MRVAMRVFVFAIAAFALFNTSANGQIWDKFYVGAANVQCD